MKPVITAFKTSPDEGRGQARDMRIRWAMEEVGQPYDVRLVTFEELEQPDYLSLHPFGQIPVYQEGDLVIFESGAILLHIAEKHRGLLPEETNARARAISWMFSALNTVEPPIVDREYSEFFEADKPWHQERLASADERIRETLRDLSARLGSSTWLGDEFSAADILMVTVLRRLEDSSLLDEFPNLQAYVSRGKARPAFQRAFSDQLAVFNAQTSPG